MFGFWEIAWIVMVPAVLYAAWIDFAEKRVPNWINALIAAAGLLFQGLIFGWSDAASGMGVSSGLMGILVGFAVLILPWMMHGMGAGDVKLMMAIGAWLGPWLTLVSFVAGALIGGVAGVIMIVSSGRTLHAATNIQTIMVKVRRLDTAFSEVGGARSFGSTSQLLPYGVPLTAGMLLVLAARYFGGWFA